MSSRVPRTGHLAAIVCLVTAITAAPPAQAQQPPRAAQIKPKPKAERAQRNYFLLRPILGYSYAGLSIDPASAATEEAKDNSVVWTPNTAAKVGARAGYGPFLVTLTVDWQALHPVETHGKSRGLEIGFTSTWSFDERDLATTFFYNRYRGFYLTTSDALYPGLEAPLLAPRLEYETYGVNLLFFFDRDFSYDDAFVEYRPKPRGEFSPGVRLAAGRLSFDSGPNALIPGKYQDDFGEAAGLTAVNATYASLGGGVGADWRPAGRVLLGLVGFVGVTVSSTAFRNLGYLRRTPTIGAATSGQGVAGYAGDLFHFGVMLTFDLDGMRIEGADVLSVRFSSLLFLGITI